MKCIMILILTLLAGTTFATKTYLEGDILITKKQFEEVYGKDNLKKYESEIIFEDEDNEGNRRNLELLNLTQYLWSERINGKIVIPWTYHSPNGFTTQEQQWISQYMTDMENKLEIITFVERTTEVDYVEVIKDNTRCMSMVGRVGGRQELYLANGCLFAGGGILEHEFMHVLGIFHEHTRYDRDTYVTVFPENIESGFESNFIKRSPDHTTFLGVGYDYYSVMHYGRYDFSINFGVDPVIDAGIFNGIIGQRDGMSEKDIEQIRLMYKCGGGPRYKESFCTTDCLCDEGEGNCELDLQCSGELSCVSGYCATTTRAPTTRGPTMSPPTSPPTSPTTTLSPTTNSPTNRPTNNPTTRATRRGYIVDNRSNEEHFLFDSEGNLNITSIIGLASGVLLFVVFSIGLCYYYWPDKNEQYEIFIPDDFNI